MQSSCSTDYWSRAVWSLPARQMSFAVNSAQDTLPHNSNLVRWKRPVSPWCPLCGDLQTLRHVLNGCKQALQERRYDQRHDEILREIVTYLGEHLSDADYQMVADLDSGTYTFPIHICPTTECDGFQGQSLTKQTAFVSATACTNYTLLNHLCSMWYARFSV